MAENAGETKRLPAILGVATATVLGVDFASARAYDAARFGQLAFATGAGLLLGGIALLWLLLPRVARYLAPRRALARAIAIVPIAGAIAAIHVRGILDPGPLLALGVLASLGVATMVAGAALGRTPVILVGALASGVALRLFELKLVPIAPSQGDMLPLVVLAIANVAAGHPPYGLYHFPWEVPLTYLPVNWLAYAPLLAAGIDPRWTNVLADLAVLGSIYFAARNRRDKVLRDAAVVLWCAWFVAHRMIKYDAGIAAQVQWAALSWLAALALERSRWTAAALGVALATTPLALTLAPTLAIAWHRGWNRPGSKRPHRATKSPLVRGMAVAAVVGAILVLPWLLWSPREFVFGVVLWFNDIDRFPREKWLENRAWIVHPGLAGLFWTMHAERLLKPIQGALLAGLALLFARATAAQGPRATLGGELVAVFLVFLLFNPMVWAYLLEPAVCLSLVALASARAE